MKNELRYYPKGGHLILKGRECGICHKEIPLQIGVVKCRRRLPDKTFTKWKLLCGHCFKNEEEELENKAKRILGIRGITEKKKPKIFKRELDKLYKELELRTFGEEGK